MRGLIIVILLVVAGILGWNYYNKRRADDTAVAERARTEQSANRSFADQAHDTAVSAKDAISDKLDQWHLSGSDIKRDLEKTGEVVRTKAKEAGTSIANATSNARIVSSIKTKFALDKDLKARSIEVSCDAGHVTLAGNVATEALIGKAVAFALDTEGVVEVKSLLKVQPSST